MSRNGIEADTFHKLCDNKAPTNILIKLKDGNILGLYTPLDWSTKSIWISHLNIFVFSLTQNLKYVKNNQKNNIIYCDTDCEPHSIFLRFNKYYKMSKYILPSNSDLMIVKKYVMEEMKVLTTPKKSKFTK